MSNQSPKSFQPGFDSANPRLFDVGIIEALADFWRRRPYDLNRLTRDLPDSPTVAEIAYEAAAKQECGAPILRHTIQCFMFPTERDGSIPDFVHYRHGFRMSTGQRALFRWRSGRIRDRPGLSKTAP